MAKKFIKKIIYSPENIKINLFYSENPADFPNFGDEKSPALRSRAGLSGAKPDKESSVSLLNNQFVSEITSAQIKRFQTFSIILPNLIHQSKKKNLKKR